MPESNSFEETLSEPIEKIQTPAEEQTEADASSDSVAAPRPKRNSGRSAAKTDQGRYKSARNATTHGLTAKTLILTYEDKDEWLELLSSWVANYQTPAENTVLYSFVLKTAEAEWLRRRAKGEYDYFFRNHNSPPMYDWKPEKVKQLELITRYLTTAERRFQREYRLLEHHFKTHHKPAPEAHKAASTPAQEPELESSENEMPLILFINNETGEAVDAKGNRYAPPPDYKCEPIIPGVYRPGHPSYIGPLKSEDSPTGKSRWTKLPPTSQT